MFLYFVPQYFANGIKNIEYKKRLMLVVNKNTLDNTLTLINISKVDGKPNCFTYPFNVSIIKYNPPLTRLSFAKINDNYVIENFVGLEKYLYKNGQKVEQTEYNNIMNRYKKHIVNNKVERNSFTKEELLETNK